MWKLRVDWRRWLWLWGLWRLWGLYCNLPEDLLPLLAYHVFPSFLLNSVVVFRTNLDISRHVHHTRVGVQDAKATRTRGMIIKILANAEEEASRSWVGKLPLSVLLQPIPGGCAKCEDVAEMGALACEGFMWRLATKAGSWTPVANVYKMLSCISSQVVGQLPSIEHRPHRLHDRSICTLDNPILLRSGWSCELQADAR